MLKLPLLYRLKQNVQNIPNLNNVFRYSFSTTVPKCLKEIRETQNGKQLVIEGVIVPSPREKYFLKTEHDCDACPLCRLNLDIKHTDVLILCQFLRSDGCMLPRRVTGLCKIQQRRVTTMVAMAQKAGLMMNITPANCKKDPLRRRDWKKCNTYFDEETIRLPKMYRLLLHKMANES
uniref:Large ribosomal subunit protein mL66 n=1 Tax=Clastoptera arizonana TaxID=38151 RepID=A0A1B6CLE2_9HEMI